MRYSVIVPAYNAARDLDACLRALFDQSVAADEYEVLVVDDGSSDTTAEVAACYPVRLLRQAHAGPASARNLGAHSARGEFLLFTDADCVPVQTWLAEIVKPLELDARVGGTKGVYRTRQAGLVPRLAQVEFEEKYAHLRQQESIDFIDTSSAAFRRDAFWQAGGFDTVFETASNEDTQLSFTLAARGWRLVFCDRAIVYHRHSETLGRYLHRKWRHGYWRVRVYQRHPAKMAGDSYTPHSTQLQMLSALLAVACAPLAITRRLSWLSLMVFVGATMPFVRRARAHGWRVALSVPPVLFLRALALGSGLAVGALRMRAGSAERVLHEEVSPPPEPASDPPREIDGPSGALASDPRGKIDGPSGALGPRRLLLLFGWAVDCASSSGPGIELVRVFVDEVLVGTATYGLLRPDVEASFGPQFLYAGWRFALDLTAASRGPHTVRVDALSAVSGQTTSYDHVLTVGAAQPAPAWRKFVLFISAVPDAPMRYRCEHAAEQVRAMGGTADVALYADIDLAAALEGYDVFVLHRVLYDEDVQWFMDQARRRHKPIVYDVDDLIFDTTVGRYIAELERMQGRQPLQFFDCVARTREALVAAPAALVSTEPLKNHVDHAAQRPVAHVAPNVVSQAMLRQAEAVLAEAATRRAARDTPGPLRVAYLSGTPTHDRDFLQAAGALIWALDQFPDMRLVTVGPVTLDQRFERFGERVERWPLVPWRDLLATLAAIDVNLAPLEADNPFTAAKSCIKYLEAGLVGRPTIASPRADFRQVIDHGRTGLLAETLADWQECLAQLLSSREFRQAMGQRARADVVRQHTTLATAEAYLASLAESVDRAPADDRLSINWVVSAAGPTSRNGPIPGATDLVPALAALGHQVRVWPVSSTLAELLPADVSIATDSLTAHLVAEAAPSPFRAYFVDEALDAQAGSDQVEASRLPLRLLCAGRETAQHIAQLAGRPTVCVEGPADLERALLALTCVRGRASVPA